MYIYIYIYICLPPTSQVDGYDDAVEVLVDLFLMAECDALVGKFSSNIDRIAYSLMAARRGAEMATRMATHAAAAAAAGGSGGGGGGGGGGAAGAAGKKPLGRPRLCLPPYVSLDHPWCADFGTWMPLRFARPPPYAGVRDAGGAPRLVGGFQ